MRAKDDHNPTPTPTPEMHEIEKKLRETDGIVYADGREDRLKDSGEVFTPMKLVYKMLDELDFDWSDPNPEKTFLDPTMGTGNFLVGIASRNIDPKNIYGVDIMQDNVEICRERLKDIHLQHGHKEEYINFHHNRNIIQGDALTYDYSFHEVPDLEVEW